MATYSSMISDWMAGQKKKAQDMNKATDAAAAAKASAADVGKATESSTSVFKWLLDKQRAAQAAKDAAAAKGK